MFISWRSRPVKTPGGGSFLAGTPGPIDGDHRPRAWHSVRCEHSGGGRIAWTAFVMRSERVDGKPRQRVLHRFPTIRSCCIADPRTRAAWWHALKFDGGWWDLFFVRFGDGMYRDGPACLAKLGEVVPPPGRRAKSDFARFAAEFDRVQEERRKAEEQQMAEERRRREEQERRKAEEDARAQADARRRRRESSRSTSGLRDADFATLGLGPTATLAEVKARFRELAMVHHPDKGGDAAEFRRLRDAYERIVQLLDTVGV